MSQNRFIGVNGTLPWPSCQEDRANFQRLTNNKILIVGRNTYQEDLQLRHIQHVKWCLVVTTSITEPDQLVPHPSILAKHSTRVMVVPSLTKALSMAQQLVLKSQQKSPDTTTTSSSSQQDHDRHPSHDNMDNHYHSTTTAAVAVQKEDELHCWVAGGERIYEEALQHPMAQQIHWTIMHVTIQVRHGQSYALFPAKHRWDRFFEPISQVQGGGPTQQEPHAPYFTYIIMMRKQYVNF